MAADWIDAEFKVIFAPLRRGDPHPTRKGARFVRLDPWGRALWYIPPRFNLWQRLAMFGFALWGFSAAVYIVAEWLSHH